MLGGDPGAAEAAARELCRRHPGLRIAGYGLQGFTANHPFWNILLYLLPLLGAAAALAVLMGFDPEEMLQRRRAIAVTEAAA